MKNNVNQYQITIYQSQQQKEQWRQQVYIIDCKKTDKLGMVIDQKKTDSKQF